MSLCETLLWDPDPEQQPRPSAPAPAARDPGPAARSQRRGRCCAPALAEPRRAHPGRSAPPAHRHRCASSAQTSAGAGRGDQLPRARRHAPRLAAPGSRDRRASCFRLFPSPSQSLCWRSLTLSLSRSLALSDTLTHAYTYNPTPIYTLEEKTFPSRPLPLQRQKLSSRVVGAPGPSGNANPKALPRLYPAPLCLPPG